MDTEKNAEKQPDFLPLNAKEVLYECPNCRARPYISLHNCPAEPLCHMCGKPLVRKQEEEKTTLYADNLPYIEMNK